MPRNKKADDLITVQAANSRGKKLLSIFKKSPRVCSFGQLCKKSVSRLRRRDTETSTCQEVTRPAAHRPDRPWRRLLRVQGGGDEGRKSPSNNLDGKSRRCLASYKEPYFPHDSLYTVLTFFSLKVFEIPPSKACISLEPSGQR